MTNQLMFQLPTPKQKRDKNTQKDGEKDVIHGEASEVRFLNRDVLEQVFHLVVMLIIYIF